MATTDLEIKVSLEPAIHNAMQELATNYYKEYGVMIESIDFDWTSGLKGKSIIKTSLKSFVYA